MAHNPRFYRQIGRALKIALASIGVVALWTLTHWLKNIYLGNSIAYQEHFIATTEVNILLIILTFSLLRFVWKEFAFTLVELSIVLIVIGFIIAGVMGGISMVKAASLNSTITEANQYKTAINIFRDRFRALPGDFANAYNTWPSMGCTANDVNSVGTGCNGNGNGLVFWQGESARGWQHLVAAGLIGGTYNGTTEFPVPKFLKPGGAGLFLYALFSNDQVYVNAANSQNYLLAHVFGATVPVISSADGYALDTKVDDGRPATGGLIVADTVGTRNCVVNTGGTSQNVAYAGTDLSYVPTQTNPNCSFVYWHLGR